MAGQNSIERISLSPDPAVLPIQRRIGSDAEELVELAFLIQL